MCFVDVNKEKINIENQRIKFENYLDDNYETCKRTSKIKIRKNSKNVKMFEYDSNILLLKRQFTIILTKL